MSKQGTIRTKASAQDGISTHSSGTVKENGQDGLTYQFHNLALGNLGVGDAVTFDTTTTAAGDTYATGIQAAAD
jgi:hypothetical protein